VKVRKVNGEWLLMFGDRVLARFKDRDSAREFMVRSLMEG